MGRAGSPDDAVKGCIEDGVAPPGTAVQSAGSTTKQSVRTWSSARRSLLGAGGRQRQRVVAALQAAAQVFDATLFAHREGRAHRARLKAR